MNDPFAGADEAAAAALPHSRVGKPRLGVVLGSGLGQYCDGLQTATSVSFADLPHFSRPGVPGHAGRLWFGQARGIPVAVLQGRLHLYEGFSPAEVVHPVRTLAALGVEVVCLTNAAGGVRESFAGGELMRIVDHLNLTGQNPLIGADSSRGTRFPDLSQAYDAELGESLEEVAGSQGLNLHEGVYAQLTGPSYETPAEIRMLRALGADAVGMSTVHETIALRHLGIRVVAISCITNPAAGVSSRPVLHSEVTDVAGPVGGRDGGTDRWVCRESVGLGSLVGLEVAFEGRGRVRRSGSGSGSGSSSRGRVRGRSPGLRTGRLLTKPTPFWVTIARDAQWFRLGPLACVLCSRGDRRPGAGCSGPGSAQEAFRGRQEEGRAHGGRARGSAFRLGN